MATKSNIDLFILSLMSFGWATRSGPVHEASCGISATQLTPYITSIAEITVPFVHYASSDSHPNLSTCAGVDLMRRPWSRTDFSESIAADWALRADFHKCRARHPDLQTKPDQLRLLPELLLLPAHMSSVADLSLRHWRKFRLFLRSGSSGWRSTIERGLAHSAQTEKIHLQAR